MLNCWRVSGMTRNCCGYHSSARPDASVSATMKTPGRPCYKASDGSLISVARTERGRIANPPQVKQPAPQKRELYTVLEVRQPTSVYVRLNRNISRFYGDPEARNTANLG